MCCIRKSSCEEWQYIIALNTNEGIEMTLMHTLGALNLNASENCFTFYALC